MSLIRLRMRRDETGAVLVIFALIFVVLLLFAALAVDLGAAWAQRTMAQSAADASVMAAASEYLRPAPPDETGVFDLVNDYANSNLSGPALEFDDWAACVDDGRPSDYVPLGSDGTWVYPGSGGTASLVDCISLKQLNNEPAILRVRLPTSEVPTSFARLIGIETIPVAAFAEAEIRYSESAMILPFSLPSNPNPTECLGTPPSGLLPSDEAPCTGPNQGNFGMIDSPWFGNPDPPFGTDVDSCPKDPNFKDRTPTNLALGLDHIITAWPDSIAEPPPPIGTSLGNNHPGADSCDNVSSSLPPYVLLTETGNTQTGSEIMHDGFLGSGFGNVPTDGRLRQLPAAGSVGELTGENLASQRLTIRTTNSSIDVDNVGLWEYLDRDQNPPGDCHWGEFDGKTGRDLTDQMLRCITVGTDPFTGATVNPDPAPKFTDDILGSPRFALVPVLNYARGAQFGSKWWGVISLQPVYIQTTWYTCGNPTGDCLFEPDDFGTYVHPNTPPPTTTTTTSTTTTSTTGTTSSTSSTTTTQPPTTTTTLPPTHGKSVFFNPGEGSAEPCLLVKGNCGTPKTLEMAGSSAFVIDETWLGPAAANSIGASAPYDVYLRR